MNMEEASRNQGAAQLVAAQKDVHPRRRSSARGIRLLLLPAILGVSHGPAAAAQPDVGGSDAGTLRWTQVMPLPDREGFAAMFAGVSDGALLVAGGANFPGKKPWEGGMKAWHDTVLVLEKPEGAWRVAGKLPRPSGYGVSVTTPDGVLCVGGSDARRHSAGAFLLQWSDGKLRCRRMPPLPAPCANMCGVLVGRVVYVAGGTDSPLATNALRTFWAFDLSAKRPRWQALEPWPGPGRMLAGSVDAAASRSPRGRRGGGNSSRADNSNQGLTHAQALPPKRIPGAISSDCLVWLRRNSHGGSGCGSVQSPRRARRASASKRA